MSTETPLHTKDLAVAVAGQPLHAATGVRLTDQAIVIKANLMAYEVMLVQTLSLASDAVVSIGIGDGAVYPFFTARGEVKLGLVADGDGRVELSIGVSNYEVIEASWPGPVGSE